MGSCLRLFGTANTTKLSGYASLYNYCDICYDSPNAAKQKLASIELALRCHYGDKKACVKIEQEEKPSK